MVDIRYYGRAVRPVVICSLKALALKGGPLATVTTPNKEENLGVAGVIDAMEKQARKLGMGHPADGWLP